MIEVVIAEVNVIEVHDEVEVLQHLITEVVDATVAGPQGQGIQGIQGVPGQDGAGGGSYRHDQLTPEAVWVIAHALNFYPNITVEDSAGTEHFPDIVYDSADQVTLTFVSAMGGSAFLS